MVLFTCSPFLDSREVARNSLARKKKLERTSGRGLGKRRKKGEKEKKGTVLLAVKDAFRVTLPTIR